MRYMTAGGALGETPTLGAGAGRHAPRALAHAAAGPALAWWAASASLAGAPASWTMRGRRRERRRDMALEESGTVALTAREKSDLLDRVELFAGMGGVPLSAIADRAVEVEFPAGRTIVRQGEIGTGFFLIVSGGARIVRDGAEIARLGPGDFFGELSLLAQAPRIA